MAAIVAISFAFINAILVPAIGFFGGLSLYRTLDELRTRNRFRLPLPQRRDVSSTLYKDGLRRDGFTQRAADVVWGHQMTVLAMVVLFTIAITSDASPPVGRFSQALVSRTSLGVIFAVFFGFLIHSFVKLIVFPPPRVPTHRDPDDAIHSQNLEERCTVKRRINLFGSIAFITTSLILLALELEDALRE